MPAVRTTATKTPTSWSALKGPTNGLRQFTARLYLRPQEAERLGEDGQPVEQDRQADDHDQRTADELDLPPVLEDRSCEARRVVDRQRQQDERNTESQRVGDQLEDDLRADRDRGQGKDGAQGWPDARRPADREYRAQCERSQRTSRSGAAQRLLAELRL